LILAHWEYFIGIFTILIVIAGMAAGIEDWWQRRQRDKEKKK